jgi:site-specific recombinase XerD
MAISYKALIKIGNRTNKSGKYSILLRVTMNRRSIYLNLGKKIEPRYWQGDENKWIKSAHPQSHKLNHIIREKIHVLQEFELKQTIFKTDIDLEKIAKFYNTKGDPSLVRDYIENFIKTVRGKSLNTIKVYKTFQKQFIAYSQNASFGTINEKFIQAFAVWLNEEKNLKGKTVHKMISVLSLVCKKAVEDGHLERDPFYNLQLKVKTSKANRIYLDEQEIIKLKQAKLPADRPDLEETRRLWLFCFYAGFYYSDLRKLTWGEVKSTDMGHCLVYKRFKNDNPSIAPIHKFGHAVSILEQQKGLDDTFVFPDAISEQKYNEKLKELAIEAKIDKPIMNKTARHSAMQYWVAKSLPVSHAAKIAGHNSESTTKHYYNLSTNDVNNSVEKIDTTIFD